MDFALATSSEFPSLQSDYRPLLKELERRGFTASPVVWNDKSVDWQGFKNVVICSTWDYQESLTDFSNWLEKVASASKLINSKEIVEWNLRKTYLKKLSDDGVPIIPTFWIESAKNAREELSLALSRLDTSEFVIKPAIGAGSNGMRKFESKADLDSASEHAVSLLGRGAPAMVQPSIRTIEELGETVLVYFDGKFSHAAHRPLAGHQAHPDEEVATSKPCEPKEKQRKIADKVAESLPFKPAYMRVDLIEDEAGNDMVLELEMIEPSLFLETDPTSFSRYASAVAKA